MTLLSDKHIVKLAVDTYNKRHPDKDDLNYDHVLGEIKYALKSAQRDLKEKLLNTKKIWCDIHNCSEYLMPDGEARILVQDENFKAGVFDSVQITIKEN